MEVLSLVSYHYQIFYSMCYTFIFKKLISIWTDFNHTQKDDNNHSEEFLKRWKGAYNYISVAANELDTDSFIVIFRPVFLE